MGNVNSTSSGNTDDRHNAEQAPGFSYDTGVHPYTKGNIMQNIVLVWLDINIDEKNDKCRSTLTQLRSVVNNIYTFTDSDKCIQFIDRINDNKVCLIVSGSNGEIIMPQVHEKSQIDSIFIFCANKKKHEEWTKKWSKIKGVFVENEPICSGINAVARQCEHNSIAISCIPTNGDISSKRLNQIDSSFMYNQILKEILLTTKFEQKHFEEFINYCREQFADNKHQLENVNKLAKEYRSEKTIEWYTYDSFLYPTLNRALRTMDMDIIIRMGFFINDLHRHLEQLHSEQYKSHQANTVFTVYRVQGTTKLDLDQMTKAKGGLISFNNFLLTNNNEHDSFHFARNAEKNPDLVGVLFVMTIDPSKSTIPFASITDFSCHEQSKSEILFSIHSVFRIDDIKPKDENGRLFQVNLTLTSENDKDLRALTDCIREQTSPEKEGWYRLGYLLFETGKPEKAEQICEVILKQATNEIEKATIYHQLGLLKDQQKKYKEAMTCYEQELRINQNILTSNHPDLAASYNNIATVCHNMGEHQKALSHYQKALEIKQKYLPPNHSDLAATCDSIGLMYYKMNDSSQALSYYRKALEIKEKTLPSNHPSLAFSYNNIGGLYAKLGEYSNALSFYEKDLEIKQKTLPPLHPDLGASYNKIGMMHSKLGDRSKAQSFFERAVDNAEHSLSPNHSTRQLYKKNLDNVNK